MSHIADGKEGQMCEMLIIRGTEFPYLLLHWIGIGDLSKDKEGNYENLEDYSIDNC